MCVASSLPPPEPAGGSQLGGWEVGEWSLPVGRLDSVSVSGSGQWAENIIKVFNTLRHTKEGFYFPLPTLDIGFDSSLIRSLDVE